MKKRIISIVLTLVLVLGTVGVNSFAEETTVKNVILLIPDGMSIDAVTVSRWYNGGELLAMDSITTGLVRTYSADAPIADSAPAGTAMATGFKSHTGYVGVLPDVATMYGQTAITEDMKEAPVASIVEAAQLSGKATGLIATSEVMHATPADFSAHYPSRKAYDILSEQMVYNDVDVVFGGGSYYMNEGRKDGKNMLKVLEDEGYDVLTTKAEFDVYTGNKVWGLFAPESLPYDMDKDSSTPDLATMTTKAIDILSQDKDGFFLMVEGSKIDWAAHANDPIGVVSDVLAFDKAVKVALDYAKKHQDTVVVVAADHGTGGISFGNSALSNGYDKTALNKFIQPLSAATLTGEGIDAMLNEDRSNIVEVMEKYYGITDLTDAEIQEIKDSTGIQYTVGPMISKRAYIGWTTNGHTGQEVALGLYSPTGDVLSGVVDNTDIATYMASQLGLSLSTTTSELFVPSREAFEAKGATVTWNNSDKNNMYIQVTKGSDILKLYVNTNKAVLNGKVIKLEGIIVFNGIRAYVPQDAVDLIK